MIDCNKALDILGLRKINQYRRAYLLLKMDDELRKDLLTKIEAYETLEASLNSTKLILKVNHTKEMAMVVWQGNNHPFVIVHTQDKLLKVGMPIKDWCHGKYYATLDEALKAYKEYDK